MKHLSLLLLVLISISCTDSLNDDATPKLRPVYFMNATLEKTGREVRVMIDTMDMSKTGVLITVDLSDHIGLHRTWLSGEYQDQQRDWYPFYDVILDWTTAEFRFFANNQRYGDTCKEVSTFERQEGLTGEHIDIVIGGDGARRMFYKDLSRLPIDKRMTVPYDWGTSDE